MERVHTHTRTRGHGDVSVRNNENMKKYDSKMEKSPLKMVDTVYQDYKISNGQQKTFYQKKKLNTNANITSEDSCCDSTLT